MKLRSRSGFVAIALLLMLGLATTGISLAQQPQPKPQAPPQQAAPQQGQAAGGQQQAGPKPPAPGEDKPFDEVVKDMEVSKGLFTFYRKADENKVLMEIMPDQLDQIFLFAATQEQATGERGFYAVQVAGDGPFYFRRVGKSIQIVVKNVSFTAEPGSPEARATARSFPDSIVGTAKIQSKPHPERKSILVDASEFFVSDLPGFAAALSQAYQPTNYRFDKGNSAISGVKAFPENVLMDVWLHYATDNPRSISLTMPDARSVPILMKYMISSLKKTDYMPRTSDDRVGYFQTVQQDYTSDHPSTPFVRYITRWNLQKKDPNAALSEPKEPIVFWLENTIPVEYRPYFKEGVLLWNKAFEKVGIKNAIVVKQQPDDADWDPADVRYNTIRWFAGIDAAFAIGPSRANPFTGEIYDADIGFSEGLIRNARRAGEEMVGPVSLEAEGTQFPPMSATWLLQSRQRMQCSYVDGLVQQTAMTFDLLEARGMLTPEVEEKLMREYIVEVTAHEVGHTLGLRHNFRASTILKPDELNDTAKTAEYSQSASVMDYNPIVIAAKGQKQGDFLPPTIGPYDYWAIEYGYKPIQGDQKAGLNSIASRVADKWLPYSTDEDAQGTFSAISIDPRANQYDQSDDPIAYFRQRVGIINELWGSMETKLAKPGEGYQVMRRAMNRSLGEYNRALLTSSKYIGGVYHYRDHVGDPDARSPYVPVPAAKQREALDFLRTYAFSEKAFQISPSLQNKLAIDRLPGLDFISYFVVQRMDYPWHQQVLTLQTNVLNRMFHPVTLLRMEDNEMRFGPNEKAFTMADLFSGVSSAIWSELDGASPKISSLRRNLQREHVRQMTRLLLRPTPPPPGGGFGGGVVIPIPPTPRPPEDATTLARATLIGIQAKIKKALAAGTVTDPTTRAHLEETSARIDSALKAQMEKPLE